MRLSIAIIAIALGVTSVIAEPPTYPLNRSPNQKQADYIRSQSPPPRVPSKPRSKNIYLYGNPYGNYGNRHGYRGHHHHHYYFQDRYPYRYPYYYGGFYGPSYPVLPAYRTWPITPYPFRIP